MFKRSWNRIPAPDTGRTFITFVVKLYCLLIKTENYRKKNRWGPFKKDKLSLHWGDVRKHGVVLYEL